MPAFRNERHRHRPRAAVAGIGAAVVGLLTTFLVGIGTTTSAQAATVDTSAWYVLVNRNSGKAIDVSGASTADAAQVQQWTRHDGNNQQFQFVDSGGGYYRLKARHSSKVLDVYNWSTADNGNAAHWPDLDGNHQHRPPHDS